MIQICTLWSLEMVKPFMYFDPMTRGIYNAKLKKFKKYEINKRGYVMVYLPLSQETEKGSNHKKVYYHKIVALAMIHNGPYKLIEHIDDNKLNNSPDNLKFSTNRDNTLSAFRNNKIDRYDGRFILKMVNGTEYEGSIAEISKCSGIPRGTIYSVLYNRNPNDSKGVPGKRRGILYVKQIHEGNECKNSHNKIPLRDKDVNGFTILHWLHDIR